MEHRCGEAPPGATPVWECCISLPVLQRPVLPPVADDGREDADVAPAGSKVRCGGHMPRASTPHMPRTCRVAPVAPHMPRTDAC